MSFHHSRSREIASKPSFSRRQIYLAIAASLQLTAAGRGYAAPELHEIHGNGTHNVDIEKKITTITQYDQRLAIEWDSFDLEQDETVKFIQDASDIALNKILSATASTINGGVSADGHVIFVNPHGVIFGDHARINVGGLIASGLNVEIDAFLDNDDELEFVAGNQTEGGVINRGRLRAKEGGTITLLGQSVKNESTIRVNQGTVTLAAGKKAILTLDGSGLMGINITESVLPNADNASVINEGLIKAAGGQIIMTANAGPDLFAAAVNRGSLSDQSTSVVLNEDGSFTLNPGGNVVNTGTLDVSASDGNAGLILLTGQNIDNQNEILANSEDGDGGLIGLHAIDTLNNSGEITAVGDQGDGGVIHLQGNQIGLWDGAVVNATGVDDGGQISIGGSNTDEVVVTSGVEITAKGSGANIDVSAENSTRFHGNMKADSADSFARISAKENLEFDGSADLNGGKLVLSSGKVVVGEGSETDSLDAIDFDFNWSADQTITASKLALLLEKQNVVLKADDTVSVSSAVEVNANAGSTYALELSSGGNVEVEGNLLLADGDLSITAGRSGCGEHCGADANRSVDVSENVILSTAGAIIISAADNIALEGSIGSSSLRPTSFTARAGNSISISGTLDAAPSAANGTEATISLYAGDTGLSDSGITVAASPIIRTGSTGNEIRPASLIIDGTLNSYGGDIHLSALYDWELISSVNGDASFSTIDISGIVNTAGGDLSVGAENNRVGSFISSGALNTYGEDKSGDISIHAIEEILLGADITTRGGDITLDSEGTIKTASINTQGTMGANGGSIELLAGSIEVENLTSNAGNGINTHAGNISLKAHSDQEANIVINGAILAKNGDGSDQTAELLLSSDCSSCNNKVIFNGASFSESSLVKVIGSVQSHNTIQVTNAPSHWTIDGNNGQIKDLGGNGDSIVFNGFNTLIGSVASDTFEITAEPTSAITIHGYNPFESSVAGDTLIGFSGQDVENTWTINSSNSGTLSASTGPQVAFYGFSNLQGGSGNDNFIFSGNGYVEIVNGRGGNNTITGPDTDVEWLITGANKGHLNYGPEETETDFENIQAIVAGSENNTLVGTDDFSHWHITGAGEGVLSATESDGTLIADLIKFHGMHNLHGSSNGNTFVISEAGSIKGLIQGGSGRDRLIDETIKSSIWTITGLGSGRIASADEPLTYYVGGFSDIEVFLGGSGVNTLSLGNSITTNSWMIGDKDSGRIASSDGSVYVDSFIGFSNLIGGLGDDIFTFESGQAEVSGWIDGGSGSNKLDLSSLADTKNYIVEIGDSLNTANIQITNIADVNAGNGGQATLVIASGDNEWNIEGLNKGSVNGVDFTGFADLIGGSGNDVFTIVSSTASISGKLNGSGGINTVKGPSSIAEWFIETKNAGHLSYDSGAPSTAFENIQRIMAGSDSDTIVGPNDLSRWDITGLGEGYLSTIEPDGTVIAELVQFYGMHNLHGGSNDDTFIVGRDGSIDGEVRGGQGTNRLIGKDSSNTWIITGENFGTLGVTGGANYIGRFTDISTLGGGVFDDTFVFSSGDAFINTINGGDGVNKVVGWNVDTEWFMTGENQGYFISSYGKHVEEFKDIQEILGGNKSNTLVGPDLENWWHINFTDSGTLSSRLGGVGLVELVSFKGIENLRGGDDADIFTVLKDGALSGSVYGGLGNNTLKIAKDTSTIWTVYDLNEGLVEGEDGISYVGAFRDVGNLEGGDGDDRFVFSSVNAEISGLINGGSGYNYIDGRPSNTEWILDDNNSHSGVAGDFVAGKYAEFSNIQSMNGNSGYENKVIGRNQENDWHIAGIGIGSVSNGIDPSDKVDFSGITSLIGGDYNDTFTFGGGYIRDIVDGGKGNDTFILTNESVGSSIIGGEGRDKITLTIKPDAVGELVVSGVEDLTLNGGNTRYKASHTFREAGNGALQYSHDGQGYKVLYSGAAQVSDQVEAEALVVHGRATAADEILIFGNNKYQIRNNSADIEFSNKVNLTFDANADDLVSMNGVITIDGTLTFKNAAIESTGGSLSADQLHLDGVSSVGSSNNRLQTHINDLFFAGTQGAVYIDETDDLNLVQAVVGGKIDISLGGSLTSSTALNGSYELVIDSGGDITLNGQNNLSGGLVLAASGEVSFMNNASTNLVHLSANSVKIESKGDIYAHSGISIEELAIFSSDGDITLNDTSNRFGSVRVDKARSVSLSSALGYTVESMKASRSADIFSGDYLTLAGMVRSDAELAVEAVGGIEQAGELHGRTISLRSDGRLVMRSSATSSASEWINYEAQDISLGRLAAQTVDVRSHGLISDSNGGMVNVEANRLSLIASAGIGGADALETMVDQLFVSNNTGTTQIINGKEIWISGLRSNGNVHFQNTNGDVHLVRDSNQSYQRHNSDARVAGGLIDVNYEIGTLTIDVDNGNLLTPTSPDLNYPILSARNMRLTTPRGGIGQPLYPLVLYVKDNLVLVSARPSWIRYAFETPPANIDDSGSISGDIADLIGTGNEQLVEIEALADIDPAVFSNVRNYGFDDIAIRLPDDQLYYLEDED